jgi:hypothetical protein
MSLSGWKQMLAGVPWFQGEGRFPIAAYSEYMPPPQVACTPYRGEMLMDVEDDPWGWPVPEIEEAHQLQPGLEHVAKQLVECFQELARGEPRRGLSSYKLDGNAAWPPILQQKGALAKERYVILLPLALSKSQDDKGRVRWTLYGNSEQGPARPFWRSFFLTPRKQAPAEVGEIFIRRLLHRVYEVPLEEMTDLRKAGFRILPLEENLPLRHWREEPLPAWTAPYLWKRGQSVDAIRFLLTFRPFATLPEAIQKAYLEGDLHLLPCPASLFFWAVPNIHKLQRELPLAVQTPLLDVLHRYEHIIGLRILQAGWLHERRPDISAADAPYLAVKNTYRRTHRWEKIHRHEDNLARKEEEPGKEDTLAHVLFSTDGDALGLYGKPMARNVQLWTRDYHLLLDGPRADREIIRKAAFRVEEGGLFGYRFLFPPMRVGQYEVYWHRPLVAYLDPNTSKPALLEDAPLGYLTGYRADDPNLDRPVELWPRMLRRLPYRETLDLFQRPRDKQAQHIIRSVCLLLDTWHRQGQQPLPRSLARDLVCTPHDNTIDAWLDRLTSHALDAERCQRLRDTLEECLEPSTVQRKPPAGLTFAETAQRSFEVSFWKTIDSLAEGKFLTKCNADCVRDEPTRLALKHHRRDLDPLGDYLLTYYRGVVSKKGLGGRVLVGDIPFQWRTDFDFDWMGGWLLNQEKMLEERDLIVVIPGRDRKRAVIMADHYDTAYMADCYDPEYGGTKARLAAAGADDNHSATVTLMLAAPIFMEMSRRRELACDVWLIHLTGEEFPADCLGARHLSQLLVEGRLKVRLENGRFRDLSRTRIQGLYVLDMVAHNNDHEQDVFQIAPGRGQASFWLAEQAHLANEAWNAATEVWNGRKPRRGLGRGERSKSGKDMPAMAAHLALRGEVRLPANPRSTLYNTDGQVFSDAGIPAVLFMENYDINREGYHDTHDTMENIDLDYGAAVAAIAIESVARAATQKPPG